MEPSITPVAFALLARVFLGRGGRRMGGVAWRVLEDGGRGGIEEHPGADGLGGEEDLTERKCRHGLRLFCRTFGRKASPPNLATAEGSRQHPRYVVGAMRLR